LGYYTGKGFARKWPEPLGSGHFRAKPFSVQYPKHVPSLVHFTHTYLPTKMEQIECSETSAYKIQTPGNYREKGIQYLEKGESLKSRKHS